MQAVQGVSVDTVWQGKWVLLPPDREESSAFDVTPAGRELGSHFETQHHSLVRLKDLGSLFGLCCPGLGWTTVCFLWLFAGVQWLLYKYFLFCYGALFVAL